MIDKVYRKTSPTISLVDMDRPDWWPGEDHEAFTEWALAQGVIANSVTPARFPGRGLGMIATRKIKVRLPIATPNDHVCY